MICVCGPSCVSHDESYRSRLRVGCLRDLIPAYNGLRELTLMPITCRKVGRRDLLRRYGGLYPSIAAPVPALRSEVKWLGVERVACKVDELGRQRVVVLVPWPALAVTSCIYALGKCSTSAFHVIGRRTDNVPDSHRPAMRVSH